MNQRAIQLKAIVGLGIWVGLPAWQVLQGACVVSGAFHGAPTRTKCPTRQ
jgi:hypothetical protein